MANGRQDQMAALDQVLSQADAGMPTGGEEGMPPPDEGAEPSTVTCQVCGTEIDAMDGEPVVEPDLPEGGAPPGGGAPPAPGGPMPTGPMPAGPMPTGSR